MADCQIRTGTPQDVEIFVDLAMLAAHEVLEYLVGDKARPLLRELYLHPEGPYRSSMVHFAIVADRIVGMTLGVTQAHQQATEAVYREKIADILGRQQIRLFAKMMVLPPWLGMAASDEFYIHFLAVEPDDRRRGIGDHLLQAMLRHPEAQARGVVALDVQVDNTDARRLYERHGFVAGKQAPLCPWIKPTRYVHMVRRAARLAENPG